MQQWRLAGVRGVHKDAVPTDTGPKDGLQDFGSYDALVVADAATMRAGSAGYIDFEADSQGRFLQSYVTSSLVLCHPRLLR